MTISQKAVVQQFVEACLNGGQLDRIDEFCTEDFTDHSRPPGVPSGRESERASLAEIRAAFNPVSLELVDVIAEGDRVCARGVFRGTQTGDFMGIPSTGRSFEVPSFDVFRIRDGKLSDHWGLIDISSFAAQLTTA